MSTDTPTKKQPTTGEQDFAAVADILIADHDITIADAISKVADKHGKSRGAISQNYYHHKKKAEQGPKKTRKPQQPKAKKTVEKTPGSEKAPKGPITVEEMKAVLVFVTTMGEAASGELKAYCGYNGRMNAVLKHMKDKGILTTKLYNVPTMFGQTKQTQRWTLSEQFIMARDIAKELL